MAKIFKKKWVKYGLGIILPTIVLASTYPYYLINNNELSAKQIEVNNTFNKSKSLKTQDNVSATVSSASFPVKDIKITEINKLLSMEASSLGSLNIYFKNNQTFPLFDVNNKTLTLNRIDRNQNSLANQLWIGDLKGSNNETFKSFFEASFKNNYVDKIGTENEKMDFREYSNSLSIQQYSIDNPNTIPIDLILDEGSKSVTIKNPENRDFQIEQGSPLVLGLTNGYAIYDKYDSDIKIFQDQNLDLKPSFSFIDNNYLSREKILYSAIDNHKGFVGFQSSLFLIYDVDDNGTLKIYFVKNDNNNINDGKTSFDSCDFTFSNKGELTPSEVIKNIDQYKQFFTLNSSYTLPSTLNKNITLTANDEEGKIIVTIPAAPGIEFIKRDVVIPDGDDGDVVHPLIGDNNSGKNIAIKLIKTEQKTLEINGFRSGDNNTKTVTEYSVKDDRNIARYSIDEFLKLSNWQELIKNFIWNKRNDIFNVLPSSFTSDDIILDSISLTKKDDNNTQGNLSFKIKNYYKNNLPVIDPYLGVNLTLTDFSKGSTILKNKIVDLVNFDSYYAQGSVLRSSAQAQQDKPKVFDQQYVINNKESPLQLKSSELNQDFLQQVFDQCFGGNIDGITDTDITAIKIKYFDNKEGKIAISGIYLNKLYDTSIRDGIITKPNNWIFDDENEPIIVSGFKTMDQAAFTLKNETDILNVSNEKPSSYDKNKLLTLLNQNKDLIYDNTLPESFNFQYDTKYSIGQITDLQFTSDPINGTITASNIRVKNLLIRSDINHDQIVFVNEYTFINQSITLKGFYAENQNTVFTIDGNWTNYLPSDIYYGWKYPDQYPNENQVLKNFLSDFYTNNIKYPGTATASDLSIIDFNDVDNAKGKIKVKLKLENGLIAGKPSVVEKEVIINNFKTQGPTEWINHNIPLEVEEKYDIYNFNNRNIKELILKNSTKYIENPPPDLTIDDIELQRVYYDEEEHKEKHFKIDYVNKKIIFKPQIKRWFNSKGMPNWYDDATKKNVKKSEYEYEITNFFVNQSTEENYHYEYNVNLPNETINKDFFIDPNGGALKTIVTRSLNAEATKGLSLPTIENSDFDLSLENVVNDESKYYLFGSGQINLKITLKKYYTKEGKISTVNDPPIALFVKVKGWKIYNTAFLVDTSFDWGNGIESSKMSDDFIKDLIWKNRTNILSDYLFDDDETKFKDNLVVTIYTPQQVENKVFFKVNVQVKEYFANGEYKNDANLQKEITVNGFTPSPLKTEFADNISIEANLDILPSYLEKNWKSQLEFRLLILNKVLLPYKVGIVSNDIKSITFESINDEKGTIKVKQIVISAYDGNSNNKVEITHVFTDLTITNLGKSIKTELKAYELENNSVYRNLFYINAQNLKTIVKDNYSKLFTSLPNGKDSIEKVELKNPQLTSDNFLNGEVYIKITLNSWIDDDFQIKNGTKVYGENENIKLFNFDTPKPTQVPNVINFNISTLDVGQVKPNITIFDKSVIDNNWRWIQLRFADILNQSYKSDITKWTSVIPIYNQNTKEYELVPNNVSKDDNATWNFISTEQEQNSLKNALSLAASQAINKPNQYNNGSLGKIQVKVKLLKGFKKDQNNKIVYGDLSDSQGTILINISGFKSTDNANLDNSNSNVILWASIGSTIAALTLIIALIIILVVVKKNKHKEN